MFAGAKPPRIIIFKFAFQANNYNAPYGTNYNATKVANYNKFASEFEFHQTKKRPHIVQSFFLVEIVGVEPATS